MFFVDQFFHIKCIFLPNPLKNIFCFFVNLATPLGPNQQGEILVKGPQVTKGYHNKPEETKNSFLDGWFRTGDMAYFNEDRFLFITDRLKELIKVRLYWVKGDDNDDI